MLYQLNASRFVVAIKIPGHHNPLEDLIEYLPYGAFPPTSCPIDLAFAKNQTHQVIKHKGNF